MALPLRLGIPLGQGLLAVGLTLFLCACQGLVQVPSAILDRSPAVKITGIPISDSGTVGQGAVTSSVKVNVTSGTQIQIITEATDLITEKLGGVKVLTVGIQQGNQSLYQITTTGAANAMGYVSPTLAIAGSNGAGGTGQQPITFTMGADPVIVTATAANFHNQSASVTVTYLSNCGCDPLSQKADGNCNCTPITCPSGELLGFDGCCPVGSTLCNGACLPQGQQCCSGADAPPNTHCCTLPGVYCPTGYNCCSTSQCCGALTACVNGSCVPSLSMKEHLAPVRSVRPVIIKPKK